MSYEIRQKLLLPVARNPRLFWWLRQRTVLHLKDHCERDFAQKNRQLKGTEREEAEQLHYYACIEYDDWCRNIRHRHYVRKAERMGVPRPPWTNENLVRSHVTDEVSFNDEVLHRLRTRIRNERRSRNQIVIAIVSASAGTILGYLLKPILHYFAGH